jgi:hypothetical protein
MITIRRESDVEKLLKTTVESNGGEVRKVNWVGRRGAPDRLVLLPGWGVFVELKNTGKKAPAYQLREADRLRYSGFDCRIIDNQAGVIGLIADWKAKRHG